MLKKYNLDFIVLLLSLISLIWVTLYKFIFLNINEFFPFSYELSEITYNVFNSIIASGIFYYFVVYLDRKRKEKIFNNIILNRLQSIRVGYFFIQKDVFPIFGLSIEDDLPEFEKFSEICKGLNLNEQAPIIPNAIHTPINWYQYFDYFFQSDQINIKNLYDHIDYLEIDLIKLLDEIKYSHFQRALDSFRRTGITNEISGAPGPFWMYLKTLENISIYCTILEKKHPESKITSYYQERYKNKNYR